MAANSNAPRTGSPKPAGQGTKKQQPPPSEMASVRWLVLAAALGLMAFAMLLRLQPSLLTKDAALASDLFGKVGIVFMCTWLAWPAIEMLWRAPSGIVVFLAILFAAGLSIYNRKTLYVTGPFLAVAAVLAILVGRLRNQKR